MNRFMKDWVRPIGIVLIAFIIFEVSSSINLQPAEPLTVQKSCITELEHYQDTRKLVMDMEKKNLTERLLFEQDPPDLCILQPITKCGVCHGR